MAVLTEVGQGRTGKGRNKEEGRDGIRCSLYRGQNLFCWHAIHPYFSWDLVPLYMTRVYACMYLGIVPCTHALVGWEDFLAR